MTTKPMHYKLWMWKLNAPAQEVEWLILKYFYDAIPFPEGHISTENKKNNKKRKKKKEILFP